VNGTEIDRASQEYDVLEGREKREKGGGAIQRNRETYIPFQIPDLVPIASGVPA